MIEFKYGSYVMQDPAAGKVVVSTDIDSSPVNDVQIDTLAEADGGLVVKQQFKPKSFTVSGYLRADTRAAASSMKDAFKTAMAQKNQALDLTDEGVIRRYLANATNVIISDRGLTTIGYSVQFISADGMGWNVDSSDLLISTGFTLGSASFEGTAEGSYLIEPVITVEMTTVTGATNKTVTIANGETLRGVKITRTWANGDVIEINSLKRDVLVNNQKHDFDGQFPSWDPASAPVISYLDDMSSRSATIQAFFIPRWL
jgi:hypothetical protein